LFVGVVAGVRKRSVVLFGTPEWVPPEGGNSETPVLKDRTMDNAQSYYSYVRFEGFTTVAMKNAVF
jgi:hypothetical protein